MRDTARHSDLIYDVGLHKGEDTELYLSKGFRVVAFDADPTLVEHCSTRFAAEIAAGRLVIVSGAIIDRKEILAGKTHVKFHQNPDRTIWGTVNEDWANRNARLGVGNGRTIEIPAVDFIAVLEKYGVPHFIKIDIEGCDMVCVEALKEFTNRPRYLSIESDKTSLERIRNEIETLRALGYGDFKAIEQSSVPAQTPPHPSREGNYVSHRFSHGASGLFGEETPGTWVSAQSLMSRYRKIMWGYRLLGDDGMAKRWRFPGARIARGVLRRGLSMVLREQVPGWYDTHARLQTR